MSTISEGVSSLLGEEIVPQRVFTLQELRLLARMAGLEVAAIQGDMNMDLPLNHDEAHRMVAVLRRPDVAVNSDN